MVDPTGVQNPTNDVSFDDITNALNAAKEVPPVNEPPVPPAGAPANQPPADPNAPPANQPPAAPDPNAPVQKEWFDEDEPSGTPLVDPGTGAPQNQAPANPLYDKYAAVLVDPEIQMILDMKKAGKSIFEIQKEITVVDFDAMKPAEVVAHNMRINGASEEDISTYLKDVFEVKQGWEQNMEANALRPLFKSQQDQKIQNIRASAQKITTEQKAVEDQKIAKTTEELKAYVSSLPGKQVFGLQLSEADVTQALNRFFGGYPELDNPDGTPNVQKRIDAAILYDQAKRIVRENVKTASAKSGRAVAAEVNNANKNIPGTTGNTQQPNSIEDAVDGMNSWLGRKS